MDGVDWIPLRLNFSLDLYTKYKLAQYIKKKEIEIGGSCKYDIKGITIYNM